MKNGRYVLTGIVLMVLMAGAVFYIRKIRPLTPAAMTQEGDKAKGPANAPVQVVVYSDFQCPACQKGEMVMSQIYANPEYKDKIRYVFRHYPLPNHRWAGLAHQAAECAHKEGKFWEFHDRLYEGQQVWSEENNPTETFLRYAKEMNIPLESFALCLANPEMRSHVLADQKKGDALMLQSTPTYFVNGERLVGPVEILVQGDAQIRKILGLAARPIVLPSMTPASSAAHAGHAHASPEPQVSPLMTPAA